MNLPIFIAARYFSAKKSRHVINIISRISIAGIAVGSAGLIIVLSVFNGFSDLIIGLYDAFDPDIKIVAREGKIFDPSQIHSEELKKIHGIRYISYVLEENALVKYRDRQAIATIKGVDQNFDHVSQIKNYIAEGTNLSGKDSQKFVLVGSSMGYTLGLNLDDIFSTITVYVPKKGLDYSLIPEQAFRGITAHVSGIYAIQQDFDSKYIIVPLAFARELIGEEKNISAAEISINENADVAAIMEKIKAVTGSEFHVHDRIAQHDFLNQIFQSEKWVIYIILSFIILLASFSIIGSITMLIIDKKQDIATLIALGTPLKKIRNIFSIQGMMIILSGGITGLGAGALICLLQQKFHLIKISNSEAFLIDAYPVQMQLSDFLLSFILIVTIGIFISWITTRKAISSGQVMNIKS